jgi:hypothetical protein
MESPSELASGANAPSPDSQGRIRPDDSEVAERSPASGAIAPELHPTAESSGEVEEQGLRSSHGVDDTFDEKEKDLRRQWEALGRPPCPEDECPNRAHPPPCDPAKRDRIRAERSQARAARKAAKAAEQTLLAEPPVQESRKRKASSNLAGPAAKR